jgi:hypothetical protein
MFLKVTVKVLMKLGFCKLKLTGNKEVQKIVPYVMSDKSDQEPGFEVAPMWIPLISKEVRKLQGNSVEPSIFLTHKFSYFCVWVSCSSIQYDGSRMVLCRSTILIWVPFVSAILG